MIIKDELISIRQLSRDSWKAQRPRRTGLRWCNLSNGTHPTHPLIHSGVRETLFLLTASSWQCVDDIAIDLDEERDVQNQEEQSLRASSNGHIHQLLLGEAQHTPSRYTRISNFMIRDAIAVATEQRGHGGAQLRRKGSMLSHHTSPSFAFALCDSTALSYAPHRALFSQFERQSHGNQHWVYYRNRRGGGRLIHTDAHPRGGRVLLVLVSFPRLPSSYFISLDILLPTNKANTRDS